MSANQIKVRRKELPEAKMNKLYLITVFAVVILLGAIVTFSFVSYPSVFFQSSAPLEIALDGDHQIIRVPANGNLQEAVNRAKSGDIIILQAGATYNEISLPNKPFTDFVTIQSSEISKLPENVRVSPQQSNLMAKIITRGRGKSAVSGENGANHFRFIGIEFAPSNADYIYNLVLFGAEEKKLADVPHDFEIDRCYFHSLKSGIVRRGLALNSANTIVQNSYFEGFAFPQEETQGICGWTGTKNIKILNNYIEGGAENILIGGSDPASADLIPSNIEIRGNYLNKPAEWKGKATVKTLFELKNAKSVQFVGNNLENNWIGSAFRLTVRNQDGKAPFSTIEDVTIKDNVINGAGEGINILGKDDTYPSQTLKNIQIVNNLFLNISSKSFEGSGYFLQVSDGENILIANNTVFNTGNIVTFYGVLPRNFLFRDNIVGHGNYGIHGLDDIKSELAQRFFQNNVFVNNRGVSNSDTSYPPGNFFVQDYSSVGFVNFANNDFRLTANSHFRGRGNENTDIGSNLSVNSVK